MSRRPPSAADLHPLGQWRAHPATLAAARSDLRSLGLPADDAHADDLVQSVALKVLVRLERGPLAAEEVVPYCRRALRNEAVSLLRGARRRDLASLSVDREDGGPEVVEPTDPFGPVELQAQADGLRRAVVAGAPVGAPWVTSAALTCLALAAAPALVDPARESAGVTAPTGGGGDLVRWIALAYAGRRDDLAAPDRADDAARRKRRSRALERVDRLLAASLAGAGDGDPATAPGAGAP